MTEYEPRHKKEGPTGLLIRPCSDRAAHKQHKYYHEWSKVYQDDPNIGSLYLCPGYAYDRT